MLFESQAKADNFILYNKEEIEEENGKAPVRSYVGNLIKKGLLLQKGVHKGSYYIINPVLIKNANADKIPTTLKTVEPDVLESLIIHDLEKHPHSKLSEIADRLPDVDIKEVRKVVYKLVDIKIGIEGAKTNRRYSLK